MTEWRDDVKKVLFKAGLHNLPITFLFLDTQVPWAVGRVHGGLDTIPSSMASWKVVSPLCPGHLSVGWFLGGMAGTEGEGGPQMGRSAMWDQI